MNELEIKPPAANRPWTDSEIAHTRRLLTSARWQRTCDLSMRAIIGRWAEEAGLWPDR